MSDDPRPPRLLLDEDLSPKVAERLRSDDGIDAAHVRDRSRLGASDREVLDLAYSEDRILVTANVADFEKLARARELHTGIIFIEHGSLLRNEQYDVISKAIEELADVGTDLTNRVLRVAPDGTMQVEQIPDEE